jgi:hypothetical protein
MVACFMDLGGKIGNHLVACLERVAGGSYDVLSGVIGLRRFVVFLESWLKESWLKESWLNRLRRTYPNTEQAYLSG